MATTTWTRAAASFPVVGSSGLGGTVKFAYGTYVLAANPGVGDVHECCKVPEGAVVLTGWVYGDDIDTGTETLDFDIGWKANGVDVADPDGFGNLGVITGDVVADTKTVAGIWVPFQGTLFSGGPKTFSAETTLTITFNAAANAGGTGRLTMVVLYATP